MRYWYVIRICTISFWTWCLNLNSRLWQFYLDTAQRWASVDSTAVSIFVEDILVELANTVKGICQFNHLLTRLCSQLVPQFLCVFIHCTQVPGLAKPQQQQHCTQVLGLAKPQQQQTQQQSHHYNSNKNRDDNNNNNKNNPSTTDDISLNTIFFMCPDSFSPNTPDYGLNISLLL